MNSTETSFPILTTINNPAQLRQLPETDLLALAKELRQFLLEALNKSGGHLGAGLGTIELTIALHYIFNTPEDRLVWDVGHQAYPHKILTGRRDRITTIRQKGGLAPFPCRDESPYDTFTVGHSSTSISAALGMAIAAKVSQHPRKVTAIIGDGAMTAGMAFEALNHAGDIGANLLVILNDNDMSISHNVGGLSNYLARVLSGKLYSTMRANSKKVLSSLPSVWELARRAEEHVKGMIIPGTLFEELGFNYIGPIDGHDLPTLIKTLHNLHELDGPQFLHVVTKKGKGYEKAEADPIGYHAVTPGFLERDLAESKLNQSQTNTVGIMAPADTHQAYPQAIEAPTYSQVFGDWLCDMAALDSQLIAITPAMREGSGLVEFSNRYPDRYIDVGIAEQHCVTLAAGLACEGLKPVVAIYSTFLQRAYDQFIHDVALQNLPVLFAVDRAGLVGGDGATHNGSFDISYTRCIPHLIIMAPTNENECRQMLFTGYQYPGPAIVRYPRGTGPGAPIEKELNALPLGKAIVKRNGTEIAILAFGSMLTPSLEAGKILNATVVNMRFIKPLDQELLIRLAQHIIS
jgi:1-deoxy-D-xylulose-5-phosphate synthase